MHKILQSTLITTRAHQYFTYAIAADGEFGFMMRHEEEIQMKGAATILLIVPQFTLFVMGDLAFYAYMP